MKKLDFACFLVIYKKKFFNLKMSVTLVEFIAVKKKKQQQQNNIEAVFAVFFSSFPAARDILFLLWNIPSNRVLS